MRIAQVDEHFKVDVNSRVVTDPTTQIDYEDLYPHYTDRRFERSADRTGYMLVFGDPETLATPPEEGWVRSGRDSDRIEENLTPEKWSAARLRMKEVVAELVVELGVEGKNAKLTGKFHQEYLRAALGVPALTITHMISWVNEGSGYPGIHYRWLVPAQK